MKTVLQVLAVIVLSGILLFTLGMGCLSHLSKNAVNARCRMCGEEFHINYHRAGLAQLTREVNCPNCGVSQPEAVYKIVSEEDRKKAKQTAEDEEKRSKEAILDLRTKTKDQPQQRGK
jgi:DNA-directed RNA polymerase subunit RPC12/RpoP